MTRDSSDHWARTILLPEGGYEYRLVVDGEWILDPLNQLSVANPFGGRNSVFTVGPFDQAPHLREAETKIMSGAAKAQQDQIRNFAADECRRFAGPAGFNSTVGRTCLGPRSQ